ncbi:hypothetical protein LXA43DRAFT_349852 [Ganoderma leucocontextum]|nr:hypothetical protein LXA43DRAFT_349852 [Ganoderma leucocontextum]
MNMPASAQPAQVADPNYYTAAMSYAEWKREPTTTEVLFRLQLPYRPPRSLIGKFLWRWRIWVEVTFALSMLEPWEKFLVIYLMLMLMWDQHANLSPSWPPPSPAHITPPRSPLLTATISVRRARAVVVMYLALGLLLMGMTLYLPHHLELMGARTAYYLFGGDAASGVVAAGDLFKSAVDVSLASIASAGEYGASWARWRSSAAEL